MPTHSRALTRSQTTAAKRVTCVMFRRQSTSSAHDMPANLALYENSPLSRKDLSAKSGMSGQVLD